MPNNWSVKSDQVSKRVLWACAKVRKFTLENLLYLEN